MKPDKPFSFFCSWSGGKDSCLALYRMIKAGHSCKSLFTMIDETGNTSRSHALSPAILNAQASAMQIPLATDSASWNDYESVFQKQLHSFKKSGFDHGVFGDIDLDDHRLWVERVCQNANIIPHEPLWQESRRELVMEFLKEGFKALIVVVNTTLMPGNFLGRTIDEALIEELEECGVDACGENGEYHTFVYDGPLFNNPIQFCLGDKTEIEGYSMITIKSK